MSLLFVDFYYLLYYFIGKYCFLVGYQTVEMSSLILFGMFCMHFYFFNYCCFYFVFLYEIHSLLNAIVNYWSLQIFPCFCRLDVKQFGMNINVFCHLWGDVSFKKMFSVKRNTNRFWQWVCVFISKKLFSLFGWLSFAYLWTLVKTQLLQMWLYAALFTVWCVK